MPSVEFLVPHSGTVPSVRPSAARRTLLEPQASRLGFVVDELAAGVPFHPIIVTSMGDQPIAYILEMSLTAEGVRIKPPDSQTCRDRQRSFARWQNHATPQRHPSAH